MKALLLNILRCGECRGILVVHAEEDDVMSCVNSQCVEYEQKYKIPSIELEAKTL